MVDINMLITRSKVIEKHMFKDKKSIKKKIVVNWEEDQIL
jgi:hypothetical protein